MSNANHPIDNNRRYFLTRMTQCIGAVAAASIVTSMSVSTALAYVPRSDSANKAGELFNLDHMQMLLSIGDLILPKTQTPSASELDCHGFVDHQLKHCYTKQQQEAAMQFLTDLESLSKQQYSVSFNKLDSSQQLTLLQKVERLDGLTQQQKDHFKIIKGLIVFGYFTSEVGATQALNYQAVPGGFKGSIPADENTLSWGSISYL